MSNIGNQQLGDIILGQSFTEGGGGGGGPVWVSPADGAPITDSPVFVFTTPVSANPMHVHMEIDTAVAFDSVDLRSLKTHLSQTGWEYWDDDSWESIPSTGIPAASTGNDARYTVQTPLSSGVWYRRVRVG